MNITPLGERVLVKPEEGIQKTKGGIFIPETAKEKSQQGTVIAVGSIKESLKKGDKVLYENYAGSEIEIEGTKHLVMNVKDILAKLD